MCGIVGMMRLSDSGFRVSRRTLVRMRDSMIHRGPDAAGLWISDDAGVGLGHRRLSIVDLSDAANQPMANDDGTIQIVFNGEIYNHSALRRELSGQRSLRWRTDHSDTEVLLRAYERWGMDCLDRLVGMFALAIWDAREHSLWLARDRLGIKPLYYAVNGGSFAFASEIRGLLINPQQPRVLDEEALFHYLSLYATPPDQTLLRGIRKVPAATWLRVGADGSVRRHRYWDPWDHTEPLVGVEDTEICEMLMERLQSAVDVRRVADVPVGTLLSGGVDSSAISALLARQTDGPIRTFTVGFEGALRRHKNEFDFARLVAEETKSDHSERRLSAQEMLDSVGHITELQDEPSGYGVNMPTYHVAKLARDHGVVVCLSGEGADELFGGYLDWPRAAEDQLRADRSRGRWRKRLAAMWHGPVRKRANRQTELLEREGRGQPLFWGDKENFSHRHKLLLLSPEVRERLKGRSSWDVIEPIHRRFHQKAWDTSPLSWMSYLELNHRLPETVLKRLDRMTMAVSLEARVPFLDHRIVELALSIPPEVKWRNGLPKHILKRAVRGLVPDTIIDRKKQGFSLPIWEFLPGQLGDVAAEEVKALGTRTHVFDRRSLQHLAQVRGRRVYSLFEFALWHKRVFDDGGSESDARVPCSRTAERTLCSM